MLKTNKDLPKNSSPQPSEKCREGWKQYSKL